MGSESESEVEWENSPPASFKKSQSTQQNNKSQPASQPENQPKKQPFNEDTPEIVIPGSPKIGDTSEQDILDLSTLSDWKSTQGNSNSQKENEDPDRSGLEAICNLD